MKRITVLGGGTGTYVVLSGLKKYPLELAAIVSMMDSGGSTGRLRDQLGVLPPGDLRQCLVALSEAPELWRQLFLYRFDSGDLKGHNFGNIFLSTLEKISGDYKKVLETAEYVLQTKGKVIPVTLEKTNLCVRYENGKVLIGEGTIDEDNAEKSRVEEAYLDPKVSVNPDATERIMNSDYIVIGPGDIYTSIVPVLLTTGIKEALMKTSAKIIFIMNLMTKSGQTYQYNAHHMLEDMKRYIGREPDTIIMHKGDIAQPILDRYASHEEEPIMNDLTASSYHGTIIEENLIQAVAIEKTKGDDLTRSVLRHDTDKLCTLLSSILV
ncbi:MAG: uridine diphosphate-N-acetylglucosamine-binding protein YvcK [Weeksellaceae bacterium]